MKISNVIRVASVLVAVAATGLAIYTKVKTEQVKNDTYVDDDIKGETIVRNNKVMKATVAMAATAGVVFIGAVIYRAGARSESKEIRNSIDLINKRYPLRPNYVLGSMDLPEACKKVDTIMDERYKEIIERIPEDLVAKLSTLRDDDIWCANMLSRLASANEIEIRNGRDSRFMDDLFKGADDIV